MPALSFLDLVRITDVGNALNAFDRARDLAGLAERLGFRRYWIAEHHNMDGVGSPATSLVISHIAAGTSTIRVGSGGIMLPNHSPLVIAEQFGTLATLYQDRIDLGVGRAPGTDQYTTHALRRSFEAADTFPEDVVELCMYFDPLRAGQRVQAIPATGTKVPVWVLGSSLFGAQLAAELGLPYAFASHFAPDALSAALALYRSKFKPSVYLQKPYVMIGVNIIAAETDREAERLRTTQLMSFSNLLRNISLKLLPPIDDIGEYWSDIERAQVLRMMANSIIGSPTSVVEGLERLRDETSADEYMVVTEVYDHQARRASLELTAEAFAKTQ